MKLKKRHPNNLKLNHQNPNKFLPNPKQLNLNKPNPNPNKPSPKPQDKQSPLKNKLRLNLKGKNLMKDLLVNKQTLTTLEKLSLIWKPKKSLK